MITETEFKKAVDFTLQLMKDGIRRPVALGKSIEKFDIDEPEDQIRLRDEVRSIVTAGIIAKG